MKTTRHYFISDNLDDLDELEAQLEEKGLSNAQIHVLSQDDVGVANHVHLHEVRSILRQDLLHSAQLGAWIGFVAAVLIILIAGLAGLPEATVGWMPYAFLAVIVFGLCLWEGGLFGIQEMNHEFREFQSLIENGKHVFFVDLPRSKQHVLRDALKGHPRLEVARGSRRGMPTWAITAYEWLTRFIDRNLLSQSQVH